MAFGFLYERTVQNGARVLRRTGQEFSLAGRNLIFKAWEKGGRLTNQGWHVSAKELIQLHTKGQHDDRTRCLVIDWAPGAARYIGLVELLEVYAYTYQADAPGEAKGKAVWTPMMLRLRDVLYKEFDHKITEAERQEIISSVPEPAPDADFVEFLGLQGEKEGFKFGGGGPGVAVFIQKGAREYFRPLF